MKSIIIAFFLLLNFYCQDTKKEILYFNFDIEYLSKINDEIFVISDKDDKSGFRFHIKETKNLDNTSINTIDFMEFLSLNNLVVNDNMKIKASKFIIHTKNKHIFFVNKTDNETYMYKVISKISQE